MNNASLKRWAVTSFSVILGLLTVVAQAEILRWQGSFQQGTLLLGQIPVGYQARYNKQRLQVTPEGQFLLGLGRQSDTHLEVVLTSPEGLQTAEQFTVRER